MCMGGCTPGCFLFAFGKFTLPEGYPLCGGWVCTLKTSYPFTKHIPVVIVMSVSHVSRYAMSWMGIEAAESHRQKKLVCGCTIPV